MYYKVHVGDVNWAYRAKYMLVRHGIESNWADEALNDPNALRITPDPSSKSGRSIRTIGFSPSARCFLTLITVDEDAITYGVNGWSSNETDCKRYRKG